MGIASLGGILSGAGDVGAPKVSHVNNDFLGLLQGLVSAQPRVFNVENTYKPKYLGLNERLLPGAVSSVSAANPDEAMLLKKLAQQAGEGLDAGALLDPALQRVTTQAIRGAQAARGMGYGPSDVVTESSALTQLGNQLRQQRQGFASNVSGMLNNYLTIPGMSLLSGATPSLIPSSAVNSLLALPYQGKLSAATSTAANNTGLYESMDSNSTSFISGL